MKKRLLLIMCLCLLVGMNASAYQALIGGIAYNFSGNEATVTYISSSSRYSGSVVIPASVTYNGNTYTVTEIGQYAFESCRDLTSIEIPNSVTKIRNYAFQYCTGLTSFTIPESVTRIEGYAFNGCTGLTAVHITDLAAWCNISFGATNLLQYAHHLYLNGVEITDLVIPNGVTRISQGLFYKCTGLTSVTIPNSVTSISSSAFSDCTGITSVTIPNSVTSIEFSAFSGCTSLTSVVLPNNLTIIDEDVFYRCSGLTSVTIPESVTTIEYLAFGDCSSLTSITIPENVTSIGSSAFSKCSNMTSVISKIVTPFTFGSGAFYGIPSDCVLTVPKGTRAAYLAAGWTESVFQGGVVEEVTDVTVTVGSTGYATFCSPFALDFSGMTDIRAYIASGFNPATGNLLLTRVTEVPAGEGLYIVGTEGSYDVPKTTTSMYYSNLLKGVTEATNISPTDGSMTNFILSDGSYGVGFYPVSSTGELAAGKAYLQLPTALLGSSVKAVSLIFDDVEEDDPTAIASPKSSPEGKDFYSREAFNLAGQRIKKMQKGINIVGGKKIFVK